MNTLLASAKRRIRTVWAMATIEWLALPAAAATLFVVGVLWLTGSSTPWWVPVAVLGGCAALTLAAARLIRLSDHDAARVVERRAGLDDVLTSALEFTDQSDPYHGGIQARARQAIVGVDARRLLPVRIRPRRLLAAAAVVALTAALTTVSPWGDAQGTAEASSVLGEEVERLEELAEALEEAAEEAEDEELEAELAELAALVAELAEDIAAAESVEEAAERLDRAERELGDRAGDSFLAEKAAVLGLEQSLQLRPLADGAGGAAEQLEALANALDGLDAEDARATADRLDALAATQTEGNSAVSDRLREAAELLRNGDRAGAAAALRSAAAAQGSANTRLASGAASRAASNAAGNAASRLRGEGAGRGDGSGEGEGNGAGEGQAGASGQGNGAGASGGGGSGGQGGGSPSGQISGVSPSGTDQEGQGGVGTPGQGPGAEVTTDVARATVFDPIVSGPIDQQQVGIDGGAGEGDIVGQGLGPTARGQALVPYVDVLPSYLSDAAAAIDQLEVPPSLRSSVRDYFDNLAEGR